MEGGGWVGGWGREGGDGGGRIIACGSPEQVAGIAKNSYTAQYLRKLIF